MKIKLFEEFEDFDEFDPFGEEIKEIGDEDIVGYFVADRQKDFLTISYVKEFLQKNNPRFFSTYQEALDHLHYVKNYLLRHRFYSDSDYQVVVLFKNGNISILGRGN